MFVFIGDHKVWSGKQDYSRKTSDPKQLERIVSEILKQSKFQSEVDRVNKQKQQVENDVNS